MAEVSEWVGRNRAGEQLYAIKRVGGPERDEYVVRPPRWGRYGTHRWSGQVILATFFDIQPATKENPCLP